MNTDAPTPAAAAHRQDTLNRVAALCLEATEEACAARSGTSEPEAKEAAYRASCASIDAHNLLVTKLGAVTCPRQEGAALDLSRLAVLESPGMRELLITLEKAQEIAERIDASRGLALSESIALQPGESRGTDLAETISEIALRVRGEIYGATGRE